MHRGGCESYLAGLAAYARRQGCRVRILVRAAAQEPDSPAITRIRAPAFPAFFSTLLWQAGVRRELRRNPARAVLAVFPLMCATHYQPHHGLFQSAFEGERESLEGALRKACFRTANRFNLKRQLLLGMESRLLRSGQRPQVMAFSMAMRRELHSGYGLEEGQVAVCPLGVDLDIFRPSSPGELPACDWRKRLGLPSGSRLLLFAAHNFRLKGLAPLLAALAESKRRGLNLRLLVAGSGARRPFELLAGRLSLTDCVHFLGGLGMAALADLYRQCDVLVHPTFHDHCSLVTLEALASGCPVITTARNGAAELMVSGREGCVLDDPRDTRKLSETMALLQDTELPGRLRNSAIGQRAGLSFDRHAAQALQWLGLAGDGRVSP